MSLTFLDKKFCEDSFVNFIESAFDDFEKKDTRYKDDKLSDADKKHVVEYKYIGGGFLDDNSEIGILVLRSATHSIEHKRVGFSDIIFKLSKEHRKETILVAIYHEESSIWRLTFVSYDFKDGKQLQNTDGKRYTYELGKDIATKTAKEQVGLLLSADKITQNTLEDVFSVEKVSKEFFSEYKALYYKTCDELFMQKALFLDESVELFTKKLLGRIVFLYFLQKKGWLGSQHEWGDGDRKFLSNQFKNFKGDNFYDEVLKPIFFEALNCDREDKKHLFKSFGMMPYLNGGLFSPNDIDNDNRLIIENHTFKEIIHTFDKYNFTIIEDTPHDSEVAIDPEMLGRVFEDLLEDRKEKGAFYTPREIVHYMCQESIINYLLTKFSDTKDELRDFVLNKELGSLDKKKLKDSLESIKVLDPAIGSGAFPMGMLHEIVSLLEIVLDEKNINLKKSVIERSIYGVDIEPSAVEIAKLRFWLSIVVDEVKPRPLPNLAYKIMVGNSLIETVNGLDPLVQNQNKKAKKEIKLLQNKFHVYFNEHNNKKKELINAEVKENINLILDATLKNFDIQPSLDMNKQEQKKFEEDTINYTLLSGIIKDYNNHGYSQELFFYKIYFKDVIEDGGFDVVIGNPPYVRQEKIKNLKPHLKSEGYKSYNGTADLYIYFFEQGYKLLKENGILSYITSNKYTRAKYGKDFRKFVLDNTNILEYIDFNGVKVFDSASVDTSILTYKKAKKKKNKFLYCDVNSRYKKGVELKKFILKEGFDYLQNDLSVDSFSFSNPEELLIKKKVEGLGIALKEWDITINRGVTTGFNEAFIIDNKIKSQLINQDIKSKDLIKPLLVGRDIKKYNYEVIDRWIINTHNNPPVEIQEYPAIKDYLDSFSEKLEKRLDQGKTFYNLRNCAYLKDFEVDKIIYPEFSSEPSFCYDTNKFYLVDTAWIIVGGGKYLTALLNSSVLWFYLKSMVALLGSKSFRMKKTYLNLLPVPKISKEDQKPFEMLVDKIIQEKEQGNDTKELEEQIDSMVYELYGLNEDEITVVEGNV